MGRVAGPHGVKGWLKIEPWSEDPATLVRHPVWWVRRPGAPMPWREVEVVGARRHGGGVVAQWAGVGSREAAEALRGFEIGLPREALDAPGPDEYYWADLEGSAVVNRAGVALGRVAEVTANGAHAILRVQDDGGRERLIPFVAAYVDRVDVAGDRIEVDWEPDY
jgi:16S rRNA processing protein RimM